MIRLLVYTLHKKLAEVEVQQVALPGTRGRFAVLANHAPLVSQLAEGNITYKLGDGAGHSIAVTGGVVKVENNQVIVLVEQKPQESLTV